MTEEVRIERRKELENSYMYKQCQWWDRVAQNEFGKANWDGNIFRGLTSRSTIILFCSTRPCITLLFPVTPAMTRDKRT